MHRIALVIALALLVAGCGGDEMTVSEYADEVEGLTTSLYQTLDDLTITTEPGEGPPPIADVKAVYVGLAEAYQELLAGLEDIDPPRDVAELHTTSLDLVGRLASTGEEMAARAAEIETDQDLATLLASPEARAAEAAQLAVEEFCRNAQVQFDATADRAGLEDVPWIPAELREVVSVVFGCER